MANISEYQYRKTLISIVEKTMGWDLSYIDIEEFTELDRKNLIKVVVVYTALNNKDVLEKLQD